MNSGEFSKNSIIDFTSAKYTSVGNVTRTNNQFSLGVSSSCTFIENYKAIESKNISKIRVMTGVSSFSDVVSNTQTGLILEIKLSTFDDDGLLVNNSWVSSVYLSGSSLDIELECTSKTVGTIEVSLKNDLNCVCSIILFGVYVCVDFDERVAEASSGVIIKELHVIDTDDSYKIMAVLNNGNNVYYTPKYENGVLSAIDISHGLYVPVYYGEEV